LQSIKLRLVVVTAAQLLLLLLLGLIGFYGLRQAQQADVVHEASLALQTSVQTTLRGVGEVLLSEGSSSAKALTRDSIQAADTQLTLLAKAATGSTDPVLVQLVGTDLTPQWQATLQLIIPFLQNKKPTVDDDNSMLLFGKLTTVGAKVAEQSAKLVEHARDSREQAMNRLLAVSLISFAILALMQVISSRMLLKSILAPLQEAVAIAQRVAKGDIGRRISATDLPQEMAKVMNALNDMQSSLVRVVSNVRQSATSIAHSSTEIAQGNLDLNQRTELQASVLEETVTTIEELGTTVKQNADNAQQANQLAIEASNRAEQGGKVVSSVIDTMQAITEGSRRISHIISVIDGIAFQTNILALNAAVEAARAGEQGRGFAVVASEVRSLAQRSSEAASEIKALINSNVQRVENGSALVDQAGATMAQIVQSTKLVTDIMSEISAASAEQSAGVTQVGETINQIDHSTQQNAALVEQSAASSINLKQQAQQLVNAVAIFQVGELSLALPA